MTKKITIKKLRHMNTQQKTLNELNALMVKK